MSFLRVPCLFVAFAAFAAAAAAAACAPPPPPPPPACPAVDGDPGCGRNIDCAMGALCVVDDGAACGVCRQILCADAADCADGTTCDVGQGVCEPTFRCDPTGRDDRCADGEVCREGPAGGACGPLDVAAGCVIDPPGGAFVDRVPRALSLHGTDALGARVPLADVRLAAVDVDAVFEPDVVGGLGDARVVALACAGPAPCRGALVGLGPDDVELCRVPVVVLPPRDAADARAVVVDAVAGAPVAGVPVVAAVDGALRDVVTDADGVASFPGAGDGLAAISAFPVVGDWTTYVAPPTGDVVFSVARPASGAVAGTVAFDGVAHSSGDLRLALSGLSLPDFARGLDLRALFGAPVDVAVRLDGLAPLDVSWPAGGVLHLGDEPLKPDFVAVGVPGRRTAWSLASRFRLAEVGPLLATNDDDGAPLTMGDRLLFTSLLVQARFDHAIRPGVDVPVGVDATGALAPLAPDVLVARALRVDVPPMPCRDDGATCAPPTRALVIVAARVGGDGLVPLGYAFASDVDGDGLVDDFVEPGVVRVFYAPPHGGLEGAALAVVAIAVHEDELDRGELSTVRSSLALPVAPADDARVEVPPFLPAPRGAWDVDARVLSVDDARAGVAHRARLSSRDGAWDVVLPPGVGEVDLDDVVPADRAARAGAAELDAWRAPPDPFTTTGEGPSGIVRATPGWSAGHLD